MMKHLTIALCIFLCIVSVSHAANKFYWANGLSGGGDAIDGIDGASLVVGDACFVVLDSGTNEPKLYLYRLQDSGAVVSSPNIISPATNAGTKRWHLSSMTTTNVTTTGTTNDNYLRITNNASRSATAASYEVYPESTWKVNTNGTESSMGHFVAVPSTAADACEVGQFSASATYIYICVASNTWRRASISSW